MKICVIDIGTNSIHTIFADVHSSGSFQVIGREKEMVRLGDGAMITGELSETAIEASLSCLERFVYLAKNRKMNKIIAVSTSAVRETKNGGYFLDKVRETTGLSVKIISGLEEARLIYLAVKNTIDIAKQNSLIVDIGGGSTEFIAVHKNESQWMETLKLGSNRLYQMFPLSDPPKKSEIISLENYVREILKPVLKRLKNENCECIVGTSGTLNNLSRMIIEDGAETHHEDFKVRQIRIPFESIVDLYKTLIAADLTERQKIKGLDKNRANMIIHGLAILVTLMSQCKIHSFMACDKALREGVLFDYMQKNNKILTLEEKVPDLRRRSVLTLLNKYPEYKKHSIHTSDLSVQLFDELQPWHQMGQNERELLEYASMLHDIGYYVSYKRHHKHTYYLIIHSELYGFSPDEIKIMAWVARLHRRSFKKADLEQMQLTDENKNKIIELSALIKIADALDHSHLSLVETVKLKKGEDGNIKLKVYAKDDAQWEVYEAKQRLDLFKKVFKTKIDFKIKVVQK